MSPILITLLVTGPIIVTGTLLYLNQRAFSPGTRIALKWTFISLVLLTLLSSLFIWPPHGVALEFIGGLLFIFGFTVIPLAILVCSAIWSQRLAAILFWGVLSLILMVVSSTFLYIAEGIASMMVPGHALWLFKTTVVIFSLSLILYFRRTICSGRHMRRTA